MDNATTALANEAYRTRAFSLPQENQVDSVFFVKLPIELRILVLRNVLVADRYIHSFYEIGDSAYEEEVRLSSQILRVCQLFYREGIELIYGENKLGIYVDSHVSEDTNSISLLNGSIKYRIWDPNYIEEYRGDEGWKLCDISELVQRDKEEAQYREVREVKTGEDEVICAHTRWLAFKQNLEMAKRFVSLHVTIDVSEELHDEEVTGMFGAARALTNLVEGARVSLRVQRSTSTQPHRSWSMSLPFESIITALRIWRCEIDSCEQAMHLDRDSGSVENTKIIYTQIDLQENETNSQPYRLQRMLLGVPDPMALAVKINSLEQAWPFDRVEAAMYSGQICGKAWHGLTKATESHDYDEAIRYSLISISLIDDLYQSSAKKEMQETIRRIKVESRMACRSKHDRAVSDRQAAENTLRNVSDPHAIEEAQSEVDRCTEQIQYCLARRGEFVKRERDGLRGRDRKFRQELSSMKREFEVLAAERKIPLPAGRGSLEGSQSNHSVSEVEAPKIAHRH